MFHKVRVSIMTSWKVSSGTFFSGVKSLLRRPLKKIQDQSSNLFRFLLRYQMPCPGNNGQICLGIHFPKFFLAILEECVRLFPANNKAGLFKTPGKLPEIR